MTNPSRIARVVPATLALVGLLLAGGTACAERPRASPHVEVTGTFSGHKVTVSYGRPFMKGRKIFGGLVPWGQVWRTGADEATTFTVDTDVIVGGQKVPKGTYALFTLPTEGGWTLILNKVAKQWGAFSYDAAKDQVRVPMGLGTLANPVEQFTIELGPSPKNEPNVLILRMQWEKVSAVVPIQLP